MPFIPRNAPIFTIRPAIMTAVGSCSSRMGKKASLKKYDIEQNNKRDLLHVYYHARLEPRLPVNGFTLPLDDQLFERIPSGLER